MSAAGVPEPVVRFGVFELDRRAGELRKAGVRLSLQPQPLQVLSLLLENRRSDIWISRESSGLWPTASAPVRLTSGPLSFASVIFSGEGRRLLAVSPTHERPPPGSIS